VPALTPQVTMSPFRRLAEFADVNTAIGGNIRRKREAAPPLLQAFPSVNLERVPTGQEDLVVRSSVTVVPGLSPRMLVGVIHPKNSAHENGVAVPTHHIIPRTIVLAEQIQL